MPRHSFGRSPALANDLDNNQYRGEKMKLKLLTIFLVSLVIVSCQSTLTKPAANQTLSVIADNTARMVFIRPSMYGGAIQSSVFDITGGRVEFIGIVSAKTRVIYNSKPGKRMFMVLGESADFMAANMTAGKTYYSLVASRPGVWKARFSLLPVRKDVSNKHNFAAAHVKKGLKQPIIENTEKSQAWFQANKVSITQKYSQYWPKWLAKSQSDKAKRTVFASDGR